MLRRVGRQALVFLRLLALSCLVANRPRHSGWEPCSVTACIVVTVTRIQKNRVQIGIQAPQSVSVHRREVQEAREASQRCREGHLPPLGSRVAGFRALASQTA